jgi:hypothetical protein
VVRLWLVRRSWLVVEVMASCQVIAAGILSILQNNVVHSKQYNLSLTLKYMSKIQAVHISGFLECEFLSIQVFFHEKLRRNLGFC